MSTAKKSFFPVDKRRRFDRMVLTMNNTTLPTQTDTDLFLSEYFAQFPTGKFYLAVLVEQAKDFFGVSDEDAAIRCDFAHGQTSGETTKLEQFVHWGCVHLLDKKTIKRTAPNEYQHITGPDTRYQTPHEVNNLFNEALAFMRHARKLEFSLTDAKTMWATRFPSETLNKAAEVAYA